MESKDPAAALIALLVLTAIAQQSFEMTDIRTAPAFAF